MNAPMIGLGGQVSSVEREWRLFHTVIPAAAAAGGLTPQIPGRDRTAYFYKRMALEFLRDSRWAWTQEMRQTFRSLALNYFKSYKQRKGVRA